MTKRLKSHVEVDASPVHYHFHSPIHTLILKSQITGLDLSNQQETEAAEHGVNLSLKRSHDEAGIDDGLAAPNNQPTTTMGESQDEEDADGDNEFHRPDSDTAGKDTSQPSHAVTKAPVICTVPRGGETHLIRLTSFEPSESADHLTTCYAGKLRILKDALRTDPMTTHGFRLSDKSAVELSCSDLVCLLPKTVYNATFIAAMLEILPTSKNLFVVNGREETWKLLSNDTERIYFVQEHTNQRNWVVWTALCIYLDERRPNRKRLRFTLYDPQNAFAEVHVAFAAGKAMSELREHATWPSLTRWHNIQHIGKVHQIECLAPDERCCSGPRVLQFVLESCPLAESPNLQSTYKVRERHFALLQGILRGDGAPELEL